MGWSGRLVLFLSPLRWNIAQVPAAIIPAITNDTVAINTLFRPRFFLAFSIVLWRFSGVGCCSEDAGLSSGVVGSSGNCSPPALACSFAAMFSFILWLIPMSSWYRETSSSMRACSALVYCLSPVAAFSAFFSLITALLAFSPRSSLM